MFNWIKALRAGERLTHVKTWKQTQIAANAVAALLTVVVSYLDLGIEDKDVIAISAAVVALVNIYLTKATTKKV